MPYATNKCHHIDERQVKDLDLQEPLLRGVAPSHQHTIPVGGAILLSAEDEELRIYGIAKHEPAQPHSRCPNHDHRQEVEVEQQPGSPHRGAAEVRGQRPQLPAQLAGDPILRARPGRQRVLQAAKVGHRPPVQLYQVGQQQQHQAAQQPQHKVGHPQVPRPTFAVGELKPRSTLRASVCAVELWPVATIHQCATAASRHNVCHRGVWVEDSALRGGCAGGSTRQTPLV
mmetsp:Transcript_104799/g.249531  ORF Transcript_104799/g.249531 Transcript_104799/m.249531 type:complete len:229 (-) Transcript_104799:223-909(-)